MKKPANITFLTYCARSGSTLLASRISSHFSGVVVLPEFRLLQLLSWRSESRVQSMSSHDLRKLFKRDFQLSNLGLTEKQLKAISEEIAGQSRAEILNAIFEAYRSSHGLEGDHFIVKNGAALFEFDALLSIFPNAQFIEITRDPRGVVNSMLNARTIYSYGRAMAGGDPIKASRIWRRFTEASQHFKATYPNKMTTVSYEDLLNNEPSTLSIIGDSLKKSVDTHSPKGQATAPVVSAREEGLHKLVHQQNEPSRAFAWKEDLQHDAGVAIEQTLLCDMERDVTACISPRGLTTTPSLRSCAVSRGSRADGAQFMF